MFVSLTFKFSTVTCQLRDSNQRLIPGVMRQHSEICVSAVLFCYIRIRSCVTVIHCLVIYFRTRCTGCWPIKIFISPWTTNVKRWCFVFLLKMKRVCRLYIISHLWHILLFELVRIIVVDFVSGSKRTIFHDVFPRLTNRTAT